MTMYQAGINRITLYEANNVTFYHYDSLNELYITDINSEGAMINFKNSSRFDLSDEITLSMQGNVINDFELSMYLLDYSQENLETIEKLKKTPYGWAVLIEFYDGTYRFINCAMKCTNAKINPQEEFAFDVKFVNSVPTFQPIYYYEPDISLVPVYRADSTIITADTTIITADYAQ